MRKSEARRPCKSSDKPTSLPRYGSQVLCRVWDTHDKELKTHGKSFVVCLTWQRTHDKDLTAKGPFAVSCMSSTWQRFVICLRWPTAKKRWRPAGLTGSASLPCAWRWGTRQRTGRCHVPWLAHRKVVTFAVCLGHGTRQRLNSPSVFFLGKWYPQTLHKSQLQS